MCEYRDPNPNSMGKRYLKNFTLQMWPLLALPLTFGMYTLITFIKTYISTPVKINLRAETTKKDFSIFE